MRAAVGSSIAATAEVNAGAGAVVDVTDVVGVEAVDEGGTVVTALRLDEDPSGSHVAAVASRHTTRSDEQRTPLSVRRSSLRRSGPGRESQSLQEQRVDRNEEAGA